MGDPESGGVKNSDDVDVNVKYTMDISKRRNHYVYLCKVRFLSWFSYSIIDHVGSRDMVLILYYGYRCEQNAC